MASSDDVKWWSFKVYISTNAEVLMSITNCTIEDCQCIILRWRKAYSFTFVFLVVAVSNSAST